MQKIIKKVSTDNHHLRESETDFYTNKETVDTKSKNRPVNKKRDTTHNTRRSD